MRNRAPLVFTLLLLCVSLVGCQNASEPNGNARIEVTDFAGDTIRLEQAAQRIVALAPHIVENVYSAGAGDKLVGVVAYSNFPAAALDIEVVAGYEKINTEKILELNPDLILAWQSGNPHQGLQILRDLGYTVYLDQAETLDDVAKTVVDIGLLAGTARAAERSAAAYQRKLSELRKRHANKPPITSFYQVWHSPLQTINGQHIISDVINTCGGTNVFANEFALAPIINIEALLLRNPQVIIASSTSDTQPHWRDQWRAWPSLAAVQNNHLFFIDPDHIQRPTMRILHGLDALCTRFDQVRATIDAQ